MANVACGLFGGLGVAGSLSKTAAASDARGRSQIAGVAAAVLSLVVIVAIAPVLSNLPRAVLSAIVVNAVWKLMDFAALRRYARVRRNDIVAAIVAAVGVLWFGPLNGLLIAVATSVLGLVYRSSRLQIDTMGRVPGEKAAWGSMSRHQERPTYPGVLVLRIDTPIFWVTAAPRAGRRRGPGGRHAGGPRRGARPRGHQPDGRHQPRRPGRHPATPCGTASVDLYLVRVMCARASGAASGRG